MSCATPLASVSMRRQHVCATPLATVNRVATTCHVPRATHGTQKEAGETEEAVLSVSLRLTTTARGVAYRGRPC